jgi:hypothetical protein
VMYKVYRAIVPGYLIGKDENLLKKFRRKRDAVHFAQTRIDELLRYEYSQRPLISPTELYSRFYNFSRAPFIEGTVFDACSYAKSRSFDIVQEMTDFNEHKKAACRI